MTGHGIEGLDWEGWFRSGCVEPCTVGLLPCLALAALPRTARPGEPRLCLPAHGERLPGSRSQHSLPPGGLQRSWGGSRGTAKATQPCEELHPGWTREGRSVGQGWARHSARAGAAAGLAQPACCSESPGSFGPAEPGLFLSRAQAEPVCPWGFHLVLGQGRASWDSSGCRR